jgi:hypothetical protein
MRISAKMVPKSEPDASGFWIELNIPDGTESKDIHGDRFALENHTIVAYREIREGASS